MKFIQKQTGAAIGLLLLANLSFSQAPNPETAIQYVQREAAKWGLTPDDLTGLKVSDYHVSSTSGLMHVYLQQHSNGIPVRKGLASIHLTPQGEVFYANTGQLVARIQEKIETTTPVLTPKEAAAKAADILEIKVSNQQVLLQNQKAGQFISNDISEEKNTENTIWASPVFEANEHEKLRLCWNLIIPSPDGHDVWEIRIDAVNGKELSRNNQTVYCNFDHSDISAQTKDNNLYHLKQSSGTAPFLGIVPVFSEEHFPLVQISNASVNCADIETITPPSSQYNIFPQPIESAIYGTRSLKSGTDIINLTASPYGWHDTSATAPTPDFEYTKGNNVFAYYGSAGSANEPLPISIFRLFGNYITGNVPWPVGLDFNYTHNLNNTAGTAFIEDAVTNLFVWNNICHDVYYLYGFNEAAGNFQQTNITGLGTGTDFVLARAQDGGGLNNANFTTPAETGVANQKPIMRMYLWDTDQPNSALDGDFDNAIIAHEYGHGVSYRLVGGPANVSCLSNFEQGGEGWSDFFGLMFTLQDKDGDDVLEENVVGEGIRSIGAYVLAEAENGEGFRPRYYSTNMNCDLAHCNEFTYGDMPNSVFPHGVGFVWCTMLWEMLWELIGTYGFEPDIYNTASTAGNIRAMKIVIEGMKLTPCDPTFPQMRDAILAANVALYGGAGADKIWAAFARRGLGFSATAGGNEAFDNPTMRVTKTVDKAEATVGDYITYTITVKNNSQSSLTNVSISDPVPTGLNVTSVSDGGNVQNGAVTYPIINSIAVGDMVTRTFSGFIAATTWTTIEINEPVETAAPAGFTPAGTWLTDGGYPNPNTSSTLSWWHLDPLLAMDASLQYTFTLDGNKNNHLSFWHWFDVEAGVDGGVLEIQNGASWDDLGTRIKKNGYNSVLLAELGSPIGVPIPLTPLSGRQAFTGYSGGYINTIVDLSGYSGQKTIRLRFASDPGLSQTCTTNGPASGSACEGWYADDFKIYDLKNMLNTANATSAQGYAESGNVGQIGTIYFEAGTLPVELIWFNAEAKGQQILLTWTTASERNNAGFELERRSENEADFQKIAWIPGREISLENVDYQYLDTDVEPNVTYYYRLRQLDLDGGEHGSEVVYSTIFAEGDVISIYPNPAQNEFFVKFGHIPANPFAIQMLNMNGQVVKTYELTGGKQLNRLDAADLSPGLYWVKIQTEISIFLHKIVIP